MRWARWCGGVAGVVLLLPLPACETSTLPTAAEQLSCSLRLESGNTWAHLRTQLTGDRDQRYQTTVDYGDGSPEERRGMYGGDDREFSHQYARNGRYVISASARNEQTNDRLNCPAQ